MSVIKGLGRHGKLVGAVQPPGAQLVGYTDQPISRSAYFVPMGRRPMDPIEALTSVYRMHILGTWA